MFKQLITLVSRRSADSAHAFLDASVLPLLRQQIRDAQTELTLAETSTVT